MTTNTFEIFGVDDPDTGIGLQECLVNDQELGARKTPCYYRITAAGGADHVVLRARHSAAVEGGGVLLAQLWVLDCLALEPGDAAGALLIEEAKLSGDTETATLRFDRAMSGLHWDEYTDPSSYYGGALWTAEWPADVAEWEAAAGLRAAWADRPFCSHGGLLAVAVRSWTMVFVASVVSSSPEHSASAAAVWTSEDAPSLQFPAGGPRGPPEEVPGTATSSDPAASLALVGAGVLGCQREAHQTAGLLLCGQRLSAAARSLLVVGPAGAGKTWLLSSITAELNEGAGAWGGQCCTVVIARAVAADAYRGPSGSRGGRGSAARPGIGLGRRAAALSRLIDLVGSDVYCSNPGALDKILCGSVSGPGGDPSARCCVVVDGLEQWALDEDDREQETEAGAALRGLLEALSQAEDAPAADIVVVGCCSELGSKPLARLCRPPGFDLVRHVHPPSEEDRCRLIESRLAQLGCGGLGDGDDVLEALSALSLDAAPRPVAAPSAWVHRLAKLTSGYLPRDISALMERAYQFQQNSDTDTTAAGDRPVVDCIGWPCVLRAVAAAPPSRLQAVLSYSFVESVPTSVVSPDGQKRPLRWGDFGGHGEIKSRLQLLMSKLRDGGSAGSSAGLAAAMHKPRGVVLAGRPGTGKSFLVQILASEANMNFLSVNSTLLLSKYFGETEENIRKLFVGARAVAPCVLFFDEFEVISKKRSMGDDSSGSMDGGVGSRVLSTFLNELDGIAGNSGEGPSGSSGGDVLVIVACSDVGSLDDAIVRPRRLQHHFVLREPSEADVSEIVATQLRRFPAGECAGSSPSAIAAHMCSAARGASVSPAVIVNICSNALLLAVKETISTAAALAGGASSGGSAVSVSWQHMLTAINEHFGLPDS